MTKDTDRAPRGKVFAIARCTHVAGGRVLPELLPARYATRTDAEAAAKRLDARLQPTVILIGVAKAEELSE